MKTVTSYKLVKGKVIRSEYALHSIGSSYLAESEALPFHQTVLNAYRQCEQEGKLNDMSPSAKTRVRDLHAQMVEYGDYK